MGIYDRDYARREGHTFLGSFSERGRVCKWLIGINVAAFIVQALTRSTGGFTAALDLEVAHVLHGQVWRLLSYAFLHHPDAILPVVFNMLFLWWFGNDIEELYGPREFLAFYLSASLAAGSLYLFSALAWMPQARPCLGAFGGVAAVLTLCTILFPTRTILLFFILPVPLWLFLLVYLGGYAYVFLTNPASSPAVAAPLGGALFAGVYYLLHVHLLDWLPPFWERQFWQNWRRRLFGPRLRLYVDESPSSNSPRRNERRPSSPAAARSHVERAGEEIEGKHQAVSAPVADEHLEAKMDAILEKISRVGKENLTESERAFLLRASEIFRRRRT